MEHSRMHSMRISSQNQSKHQTARHSIKGLYLWLVMRSGSHVIYRPNNILNDDTHRNSFHNGSDLFKITKLIGRNAIKLRLQEHMTTHVAVYVSLNTSDKDRSVYLQHPAPQKTDGPKLYEDGSQLFVISKILSHRRRRKGHQWLALTDWEERKDAECPPTKDFVNENCTTTAIFLE